MAQASTTAGPSSTRFGGQTIIVTGSNSGLGLEAARHFLKLSAARVILAVRSLEKGKKAQHTLASDQDVKSLDPSAQIQVMQLDFDDPKSIIKFAEEVKRDINLLDVLLLNGGVNIMNYQVAPGGHERVMQVNYHANTVLALELLPLLQATAVKRGRPSRLTIVGSQAMGMHTLGKNPLQYNETIARRFDDKKKYVSTKRYSDSKLMVCAWTQVFAEHVPADKVVINNVCPGNVATNFDAHLPLWLKPMIWLFRKASAKTAEEGARILIHSVGNIGSESHGKFLRDNAITE